METSYSDEGGLTPTKTISLTSGKGGVGKSSLVANLALSLGRQGQRVLLLDGDFGMANLDIMFGMRPSSVLMDVMKGVKTLRESLVRVADNVHLIPGGSGVYSLYKMDEFQKREFMDQVGDLDGLFDVMLIDTASGMDENVLFLNVAVQDIVVVVTPEPSSFADAYALVKVLNTERKTSRFFILCNEVRDEDEASRIYQLLSNMSEKFLSISLNYLGYVPNDNYLRMATRSQQLILNLKPSSPSSISLQKLSHKMKHFGMVRSSVGGLQFFWRQIIGVHEL